MFYLQLYILVSIIVFSDKSWRCGSGLCLCCYCIFFVCFSIHFRGTASILFNWNHRVISYASMRCLLHVSQTFFLGICVFRIIVPSFYIVSLIFWKFPWFSCNDPSLKSTLPHDNIVMLPFSCLHLDCVWSCFYFQCIALHLNDIDCPGYREMEVLWLLPHCNEHHSNKDHIPYTFLLLFIHICMQMEPRVRHVCIKHSTSKQYPQLNLYSILYVRFHFPSVWNTFLSTFKF